MASSASSAPQTCDVIVVGAGMVGSAVAAHLAKAHSGRVTLIGLENVAAPCPLYDQSRLANSGCDPFVDERSRSLVATRQIERESGIKFFHECGYLMVGMNERDYADSPLRISDYEVTELWPYLNVFLLSASQLAVYEPTGAGWVNPRAHVQAHMAVAAARGARIVSHPAVSVERTQDSWRVIAADGSVHIAPQVALTLGAFVNLQTPSLIPGGGEVAIEIWGKTVYHARLSDSYAVRLKDMPTVLIKYKENVAPKEAVSYHGKKSSGFYVYIFPPLKYEDGHSYIKLGHSPHDIPISILSGANDAAKLDKWLRREGADVQRVVSKSEDFFKETLDCIFPAIAFEDGYITQQVTSKTLMGDVFLGPLRLPLEADPCGGEGLFVCAGCNGSNAKSAHEWGQQLAAVIDGAYSPPEREPRIRRYNSVFSSGGAM